MRKRLNLTKSDARPAKQPKRTRQDFRYGNSATSNWAKRSAFALENGDLPCSSLTHPKLRALKAELGEKVAGKVLLDIGCGDGWLTLEIGRHFAPAKLLGIDLDATLIDRAKYQQRFQESTCSSSLLVDYEVLCKDTCIPVTVSSSDDVDGAANYLPSSFPLLYGPLAQISTGNSALFPLNCHFQPGDFLTSELTGTYDFITAFDIVTWVHLNYGDAGLALFFEKCATLLQPGGILIVDLQELDPQHDWIKDLAIKELKDATWTEQSQAIVEKAGFKQVKKIDATYIFEKRAAS